MQIYEANCSLIPGRGFHYNAEDGTEMVKLHVDEIPNNQLLTRINADCKFGGNLSFKKKQDEKLLFSFGLDECIFCQFIFNGYAWKGPKDQQAIIPKDKGYGIMISAFQSREFGFGMRLTSDKLEAINIF